MSVANFSHKVIRIVMQCFKLSANCPADKNRALCKCDKATWRVPRSAESPGILLISEQSVDFSDICHDALVEEMAVFCPCIDNIPVLPSTWSSSSLAIFLLLECLLAHVTDMMTNWRAEWRKFSTFHEGRQEPGNCWVLKAWQWWTSMPIPFEAKVL